MSREIVFALRVGPAGSTNSELRKFGKSVVDEQKRIYHEVERMERHAFDRSAREQKRAADTAAKEQRRAAAEAAKAQKEAADAAAREAKRAATEKLKLEKEAERERKRIAKEAERDAKAAAAAAVQEAKLARSEQLRAAREVAIEHRRIAREQTAMQRENAREQKRAANEAVRAAQQLQRAEEAAMKAREAAGTKLKTVFNDGAEAVTSLVRGMALMGLTSEESAEKMLKSFAKVEAFLQVTKGAIKGSYAIADLIKMGAAGAGAAGAAGATSAGAGVAGAAGAGAAGLAGMSTGAVAGSVLALAAAAASAALAIKMMSEAATGQAHKEGSWTRWAGEGLVSGGLWAENLTGATTFASGTADRMFGEGFTDRVAPGNVASLKASNDRTVRMQQDRLAKLSHREIQDFNAQERAALAAAAARGRDRMSESEISQKHMGGIGEIGSMDERNADEFLIGLEESRQAALSRYSTRSERRSGKRQLEYAREAAALDLDRRENGGLSDARRQQNILKDSLLNVESEFSTAQRAKSAAKDDHERQRVAEKLLELEGRRQQILSEMQTVEQAIGREKLQSADTVIGKLNQQLSISRQQRDEAEGRLTGARERFGMMDIGEQQRVIAVKKQIDKANKLEREGQTSEAKQIRDALTPDDLRALQGVGTQDATSLVSREAERKAKAGGFDTHFGAAERAEIKNSKEIEAQLNARLKLEREYKVEIVTDAGEAAKKLHEAVMPALQRYIKQEVEMIKMQADRERTAQAQRQNEAVIARDSVR